MLSRLLQTIKRWKLLLTVLNREFKNDILLYLFFGRSRLFYFHIIILYPVSTVILYSCIQNQFVELTLWGSCKITNHIRNRKNSHHLSVLFELTSGNCISEHKNICLRTNCCMSCFVFCMV